MITRTKSPLRSVLAAFALCVLIAIGGAGECSAVEHDHIAVADRKLLTTGRVRAILGNETDDGFEFDFAHDRLMLDTRTPIDKPQGDGCGPTVQLDDGTLVTSYSYRGEDDKTRLEVVRWKLPQSHGQAEHATSNAQRE